MSLHCSKIHKFSTFHGLEIATRPNWKNYKIFAKEYTYFCTWYLKNIQTYILVFRKNRLNIKFRESANYGTPCIIIFVFINVRYESTYVGWPIYKCWVISTNICTYIFLTRINTDVIVNIPIKYFFLDSFHSAIRSQVYLSHCYNDGRSLWNSKRNARDKRTNSIGNMMNHCQR